jgi:dienelactone hydrolase
MKRFTRIVLWTVGLIVIGSAATTAWLLRDPTPRFNARRSALTDARELPPTRDGTTLEQDVELAATSGLRVELAIRRPAGDEATPIRRPIFIVLGGAVRGKDAGKLIGDTRGAIFASLKYPYDGKLKATGAMEVLAQVPAIRRAFYDTPPAVQLALDYLLARPDVDSTRVELVGASFGAPFAAIAAARDTRVTRLWLAHGGGDSYALLEHNLQRDIPNATLRSPLAHLANVLISGPRFTPEAWVGQVAPRPVIMLNAEDDEQIPRASVELLYAAAGAPKELVWLPGQHMQGNRPEVIEALIDAMVTRILQADPNFIPDRLPPARGN